MRVINWRKFRNVDVLHFKGVKSAELFWYDLKGRIYPFTIDSIYKGQDLPTAIWAECSEVRNNYSRLSFAMNETSYCFGWIRRTRDRVDHWNWDETEIASGRLSSLPEHEYYWRQMPWLTITDRDFVFDYFSRGMFGAGKWQWNK